MLLLQISNEGILGLGFLFTIIVALAISGAVYLILRRSLNSLKLQHDTIPGQMQQVTAELTNLKLSLPRFEEVGELKKMMADMSEQQKSFIGSVTTTIDGFKRAGAQEINDIRTDIVRVAQDKSLQVAKTHIETNSVSREEFNGLKEKVEIVLASEEISDRLTLLGSLFDLGSIKTLYWQCKLIRLTQSGLAPDAEEEVMREEGIPMTQGKNFLRKLAEKGILNARRVDSYYLKPEFAWLITYAEDPDGLQSSVENQIKKEQEYQIHIRDNLPIVEDGLIAITEQYEVDSGRIDILCRDKNGFDVALELKYPAANNQVIGQILRYKEDQKRKTGNGHMRFLLVAPRISVKLKDLLESNAIEFREVPY